MKLDLNAFAVNDPSVIVWDCLLSLSPNVCLGVFSTGEWIPVGLGIISTNRNAHSKGQQVTHICTYESRMRAAI
jgi:hypothetical protein